MNYVPIKIRLEKLQEAGKKRRKMKRYIPKRMYFAAKKRINDRKFLKKRNKERTEIGWAKSDTWDWYLWHAKITSESLNYLADVVHGWPGEAWGTYEEWQCFINGIAGAYRNVLEIETYNPMKENKYDFKKNRAAYDGVIERLVLANTNMAKMYMDLWD